MEWSGLTKALPPFLALIAAGLFLGPVFSPRLLTPSHFLWLEVTALAAYVITGFWTLYTVEHKQRLGILGGLAASWIAIPAVNIVLIQDLSKLTGKSGFLPLALLAMVPVWFGDTFAYFVGKAFGKHPLAPKISPNKTIEGAAAHLITAGISGALCGLWLHLGSTEAKSFVIGLSLGEVSGFASILGDLLESAMKRKADVKDAGSLLPGHGGLLDRIDGMLASSVAVGTTLAVFLLFGIVKLHV